MTEKHNLDFSFTKDWKIEVTCILGSLNVYIWMTFIWHSYNLPTFIEKSITSVYFIVKTWYLDMGMTSSKTLPTLNLKIISEVKCQTWWRHLRCFSILTTENFLKLLFFENPTVNFHYFFLHIDNRITAVNLLNFI